MSAGQAGSDLGRILRDPAYVEALCEGCKWRTPTQAKPPAIREARKHIKETGHTVVLWIQHWQRVHPKEAAT